MQIAINDELVQQTMQVFHTNNAQIALEKALQFVLQTAKNKPFTVINPLKDSITFELDSISPLEIQWNAEQ